MPYRFQITLSEEDYFSFNIFHLLESPEGKKNLLRGRLIFIGISVLLCIGICLFVRNDPQFVTTYCFLFGSFVLVYMLLLKKLHRRNIKRQIQRLIKQGKLPFGDPSTIEFFEETVVDSSVGQRLEVRYDALDKALIVNNEYIYLYTNAVTAIILPICQVRAQADMGEFLAFLKEKCPNLTYL